MAANFGKYGGGGGGGNEPAAPAPAPPPAAPEPPTEPKKVGKVATVALLGLGVAAIGGKAKAWLDKRKPPEAAVVCKAGANGVDCEVEHKAGPKASVCFSVSVTCASGKPATGKGCGDVDTGAKSTVSITDLSDYSGCGKATDVKVADLKVTKAP